MSFRVVPVSDFVVVIGGGDSLFKRSPLCLT